MRMPRPWLLVVAALLLLGLAAGCGGDDGDGGGGDGDASATPSEPAEPSDDGGEADGGDDGLGFDCPLSAEEVGEVLGASVEKDEATCTYLPGGNTGSVPGAGFIAQMAELCGGELAEQSGFTETVDGLGVDAYLKTGGGATAQISVCAPDAFVVFVDTGDSDTERATAAAEELAKAAIEAGG